MPPSRKSSPAPWPYASATLLLTSWVKSCEMAIAAPVVIANRLTRIAVAGASPRQRDRKEFVRMGQEKLDAAGESMRATMTSIGDANQRLVRILARSAWAGGAPSSERMTQALLTSWFETLERSIAPYHRRVMSNEVRLRRR